MENKTSPKKITICNRTHQVLIDGQPASGQTIYLLTPEERREYHSKLEKIFDDNWTKKE